jgi:hypothetical protein
VHRQWIRCDTPQLCLNGCDRLTPLVADNDDAGYFVNPHLRDGELCPGSRPVRRWNLDSSSLVCNPKTGLKRL